jgi:hypothetical protein
MHMWRKLIPKRGQYDFPIFLGSREVYDILASEENHVLDIVKYLYVGMDWRGFPNI